MLIKTNVLIENFKLQFVEFKFTVLHQLIITSNNTKFSVSFKNPANQNEDTKILCSDWSNFEKDKK
jgi:hypothetical protein